MGFNDWVDALRVSSLLRDHSKSVQELSENKLYKIRQYKCTKIITYPEMKESFEYVNNLYPECNVFQAIVYHTSRSVLNDVGYNGVGGFYDIYSKTIVISDWISPSDFYFDDIKAEYTLDEVLCHELIHYAANYNKPTSNRCVEEEIAYGKSINYLRSKGRTNDFIIHKNMMPYLISVVDKKKIIQTVLQKAYPDQIPELAVISEETKKSLIQQLSKQFRASLKEEATIIGQRMITLYGDQTDIADTNIGLSLGRNLIMDE